MSKILIDLQQIPQCYGYGTFLTVTAIPEAIAILGRLHTAIGRWRALAVAELRGARTPAETDRKRWPGDYDPVADEAIAVCETGRAMYGQLAVSIVGFTENIVIELCRNVGVRYQNEDGKNDWKVLTGALEERFGVRLWKLNGFIGNSRARILANCFKHHGGRANRQYLRIDRDTKMNQVIEYEKKDWLTMIEDTRTYLLELTLRVDPIRA